MMLLQLMHSCLEIKRVCVRYSADLMSLNAFRSFRSETIKEQYHSK